MITLDATPIKEPPLRVVMAGQSNMVGYGELSQLPSFSNQFRVQKYWSGWAAGSEPTHQGGQASCGVSLGNTISRETWLIPCAVGGTRIAEWQKGGSLYSDMANKISAAGGVDCLIFYQGEADAISSADANAWATRFALFVEDIKSDYGNIPIVFAQLGANLNQSSRPYWDTVKTKQESVSIAGVTMIATDDLTTVASNDVHMNTASQIIIGQRFAAALSALL